MSFRSFRSYGRRGGRRAGRGRYQLQSLEFRKSITQKRRNMNMKEFLFIVLGASAILSASALAADENTVTQDDRLKWWREARFGMFIHWGLYSVPGGEWKGADYGKECGGASAEWLMHQAKIPRLEYATLAEKFNPVKFSAQEWVSAAKAAGMRYMVITSKHHDGFCLFDTEHTDYNVMDASPFKRDIIKELADECAKQGIRFGVYYSQNQDWYHRAHRSLKSDKPAMSEEAYLSMVQGHLRELLTNYGEMAVLWFDTGGTDVKEANAQGAMVRKLQPKTIICSRLYRRNVPKAQQRYADFESLPDRTVASARVDGDTETCMTMRHNWGYDRDDDNWKSPKDLIERLVLSASRGVNFLLNVGPTPEGTFCPEEIERMQAMGKWMEVNGESVYGTTASPVDFDFSWGVITRKAPKNTLYLHVFKWLPGEISFNGIISKPAKAYLLTDTDKKELPVTQSDGVITVKLPSEAPDALNSVIVLEFDEAIEVDKAAKGKYHWEKPSEVGVDKADRSEKRKRHKRPGRRRE